MQIPYVILCGHLKEITPICEALLLLLGEGLFC